MIQLDTDLEGKQMLFGDAQKNLRNRGFEMGGNWDYDRGMFDRAVHKKNGECIYIRAPFRVLDGELDNKSALIQFQKPYVIKHVANLGLDKDENSLLSATGFNQFQKPLDKDGKIPNKNEWQEFGEELIDDILRNLR